MSHSEINITDGASPQVGESDQNTSSIFIDVATGQNDSGSSSSNSTNDNMMAASLATSSPPVLAVRLNSFAEYLCLLPSFSGTEQDSPIGEFFDKVESIGGLAGWDDRSLITAAKLKLTGEASTFANFHPAIKQAKTWAELKGELKKRFGKLEDKNYILKFTQANQNMNETTRGFLSRVSGLASKCFPNEDTIKESLLFNQALKGLNSNTRRFIMSQNPKSFNDIWQAALQEEQCLSFDKSHAEINVAAKLNEYRESSSDMSEIKKLLQVNLAESDRKINELADQVNKLTVLVNNPPNASQPLPIPQVQQPNFLPHNVPPNFMPFYPPNYFMPPPPMPNNNRPRPEITCYACGQKGHISRNCRNKSSNSN